MENSRRRKQDPSTRSQAPRQVMGARIPRHGLHQQPLPILGIQRDPFVARHRESPQPRQPAHVRMPSLRAQRWLLAQEVRGQGLKGRVHRLRLRLACVASLLSSYEKSHS